jgi:hypothetical protein
MHAHLTSKTPWPNYFHILNLGVISIPQRLGQRPPGPLKRTLFVNQPYRITNGSELYSKPISQSERIFLRLSIPSSSESSPAHHKDKFGSHLTNMAVPQDQTPALARPSTPNRKLADGNLPQDRKGGLTRRSDLIPESIAARPVRTTKRSQDSAASVHRDCEIIVRIWYYRTHGDRAQPHQRLRRHRPQTRRTRQGEAIPSAANQRQYESQANPRPSTLLKIYWRHSFVKSSAEE